MTDAEGVSLFDITHMDQPVPVPSGTVRLANARKIYVARTYMYVAAKQDGLVIVDVTRPAAPIVWPGLTFNGAMNDAEDVIVGSTNASLFAYVADGRSDAYAELHMHPWDCLAGLLLVREAGGVTAPFLEVDGLAKGGAVLAAAPAIAEGISRATRIPFL